ncbi:hypothetical protein Tco_1167804 [Tanacetum coccineum]
MVRQSSVMDHASFPSLHEHMPSSSGGEFGVEQVAVASTKIIGNEGCVTTGLFDRGVTNTLIKKVNGDGSASAVLREIVNHPRELGKENECVKRGSCKATRIYSTKNDDDREKLIEDAVRNILGKLPPEFVRGFLT